MIYVHTHTHTHICIHIYSFKGEIANSYSLSPPVCVWSSQYILYLNLNASAKNLLSRL